MKIIKEILGLIKKHRRFLITTHIRPDGDGLGAELALGAMLKKIGKSVQIVNTGPIAKEYRFLPGIKQIITPARVSPWEIAIVLDTSSLDRLGELEPMMRQTKLPIINIDHHPTSGFFGSVNWVAPEMSSVGEMIYQLIKDAGIPLDKKMATNLYVALITDTGHFSLDSTSSSSHLMGGELLKYGIKPRTVFRNIYENKTPSDIRLWTECIRNMKFDRSRQIVWSRLTRQMYRRFGTTGDDSQEYLKVLRSIKGVRLAILFRESSQTVHRETDGTKRPEIKVSIRTEPPLDATKLVRPFGGGGHHRAAGCTIPGSLKYAEQLILGRARIILMKR